MRSTPQSPVTDVMITGRPADRAIRAMKSSNSIPDISAASSCLVLRPTRVPRRKWNAATRTAGASAPIARLHIGFMPRK
jgi:hypothetical protein